MGTAETQFVVRIGTDLYPIHGSTQNGWRVGIGSVTSYACWYESLDELVFVLINLSVASDGSA